MVTVDTPVADAYLWGNRVGAVAWDANLEIGRFEYSQDFIAAGLEIAPFTVPLRSGVASFPELNRETYHGLPGLLADSLPDRFGNLLINKWLARQGRDRSSFTPVEQLRYIGTRGMGALEYHPPVRKGGNSEVVDIDDLSTIASEVLAERKDIQVQLDNDGLSELLQVGTSAGGARAKAIIAWNPETKEVRSGQVPAPSGFEYWLLKFDGIGSGDRGLADPEGYGRIEYAYHLMATAADIDMAPARLEVDRSGRAHFMTKRFDRTTTGNKLHMLSLSGLRHFDFNNAGAYSYEDALSTTQKLGIPPSGVTQLFRRMAFNVIARNQDDHTKNIAFLMNQAGSWHLAPAFDVIWAYNPTGRWTNRHQMTISGKRDDIERADLIAVGRRYGVRDPGGMIDDLTSVVAHWPAYAEEAGVEETRREIIGATHRLSLS